LRGGYENCDTAGHFIEVLAAAFPGAFFRAGICSIKSRGFGEIHFDRAGAASPLCAFRGVGSEVPAGTGTRPGP